MTGRFFAGARLAPAILPLTIIPLLGGAAAAQNQPPLETGLPLDAGSAQAAPTPSGGVSLDLDVVAKELDIAAQQIEPTLGASVYEFGRQAIATQPQGDNQPLNRLLLQAPGVTQDSFGQLHVRGDHANLQYRLNGIILPEGINVFGQVLQTRLARSVSLITGALPAEYGLRTAGIIDIQTKTGTLDPGGDFTLYGGQQSTFQPSAEYGGTVGRIDYFVTGEVLHDANGIENPAPTFNPIHDISTQPRGFAYVSGIIDPTTRVTSIFGVSRSEYQIPNNPGQTPSLGLTADGVSDFNSSLFNENQREITDYGIVALQKQVDALNFQLSTVTRYSSIYFSPDPLGDLLFNGIAQTAFRQSVANGLQGDGSYRFSDANTMRSGFYVQRERTSSSTNSDVLPVDASGAQTSDQPFSIFDSSGAVGWLYSYYLQDEWKPVPRVTVNFGARYDQMAEYVNGRQLSPRVSVVWQPTQSTTFTAGYARYFVPPPYELIAPTTISLFAGTSAAPAVAQDDRAKPERDHYFDVSGTQVILPGLKAGLDGYYKIASDLIDEGQFGAPIILTPFNYQKGLVDGVELTMSYDIDNWSFYGNLAASKALGKNITSAQFNFSPDDLAYISGHYIHLDHDQTYTESAGVKYRFAKTNTLVSADLTAGSGLRASNPGGIPNGNSLPGYQQVNLSIVQPVTTGIYKGLELRLDIINLFDQVYEIRNGTGVGVGAPQFGPRRTVLAGISQRF
ncbi:MAG TPA: TonB-dependent receptor [Stellaceae bacterium]|jgi:outer membrane receptor protein involved in Fe transport